MKTVTLDILNEKALNLLKDLELLNLIKFRKEKKEVAPSKIKLSDKYRGIISKEQGQDLKLHIKQMRSEWGNI